MLPKETARSVVGFKLDLLRTQTPRRPFPASTGTAIETPMKVTVRLTVLKDKPYVKTPHFTTRNAHAGTEEFYCTTGVDSGTVPTRFPQTHTGRNNPHITDIREATRAAVRNMIAFIGAEHGLSAVDAYMLCSVAGDLRMHEVVSAGVTIVHVTCVDYLVFRQVDMPNYVVRHMHEVVASIGA